LHLRVVLLMAAIACHRCDCPLEADTAHTITIDGDEGGTLAVCVVCASFIAAAIDGRPVFSRGKGQPNEREVVDALRAELAASEADRAILAQAVILAANGDVDGLAEKLGALGNFRHRCEATAAELRAVNRALRENVRRGYMVEISKGRFSLTPAGEEYVHSMPIVPRKGEPRGVTKHGRLR
jgi:hypothetical protein